MRRSAVSAGRPGGLIREITWKAGRLEVICCQVPFPVFICHNFFKKVSVFKFLFVLYYIKLAS